MSKIKCNFAEEYDDDPVGALAFTDFSKPMPILEGEDAERFLKQMEENERKAEEKQFAIKTKKEIEMELSCARIMYDFEKEKLQELEKKIKILEQLNAEIEEK